MAENKQELFADDYNTHDVPEIARRISMQSFIGAREQKARDEGKDIALDANHPIRFLRAINQETADRIWVQAEEVLTPLFNDFSANPSAKKWLNPWNDPEFVVDDGYGNLPPFKKQMVDDYIKWLLQTQTQPVPVVDMDALAQKNETTQQ